MRTARRTLTAAGRTILAVSHDEAYFGVADRTIKLDAGQLVEAPQLPAASRLGLAVLETGGSAS